MGKASSSKKIKRVQQAGVSRAPGQRRQIGYPALIGGILVLGLLFTTLAVASRRDTEEVRPTVEDNWVEAYGTYVCGEFIGNLDTVEAQAPIDLHADGLIHVHPTNETNSGANATFGLFLAATGINVGDGSLTLPDGTTYTDGDTCEGEGEDAGEVARVALYQWPPQAGENTDPRIITSNIAGTRFTEDGQAYVLAFAPRGAEVPLPPSLPNLDDPDNTEPDVDPSATTTTTIADGGHGGDDVTSSTGVPNTIDLPGTTAAPDADATPETTAAPDTTAPAGG